MKAKKILFIALFTVALLSVPALSKSQDDNSDAPDGTGDPSSDVPFDGGLAVLTAVGVGYGILKMRKSNDIELTTVDIV